MGRMNDQNSDETNPISIEPEEGTGTPASEDNGIKEETKPEEVSEISEPEEDRQLSKSEGEADSRQRNRSWLVISALGILTLLIIAAMSAWGGAQAGQRDRNIAEATQSAAQIQEQYILAMQDIGAGSNDIARQRLEWVLQQDPGFPDAPELLADLIMRMSITASPTPAPTPTLTPTPDFRTRDELYEAGKQAMAAGDWTTAIDTLLKLRKEAPDFNAIEIDGWLYVALRYRGVEKIKSADLEGGTYDLALAERFGPLDAEATNYRSWAEMYVTGASFWDVDWAQAVNYFEQLRLIAPYLMDGSGWTSIDRYRLALAKYGDWLATNERWCEAYEQYQLSLEVNSDASLQPTAVYANEQCTAPEEEEEEAPIETATPPPLQQETPVEGVPIETPVEGVPIETPMLPAEETPTPTTEALSTNEP